MVNDKVQGDMYHMGRVISGQGTAINDGTTSENTVWSSQKVNTTKLSVSDLKTVVAASSDFSDFKTRVAAL